MALDKTFDPAAIESRHYDEWEKSGVFAAHPEGNGIPFTIMMPPPNVTGSLHMGHALNMSLQDILTRYYRMKGRDALWMPGTDHAGIATQMVVEKQLEAAGTSRKEMGREKFLKRVWEWKAESGGTITRQLRKLGATPDWPRERFTMDEGLNKAVLRVFVQLYKEKLIYKDKRLVNWDPKLQTAISDLEVESREVKTHMWHIAYAIEGNSARTITVATTRPETMLGDTAIAVHPDDERYKDLIGKSAVVPIVGRMIPIVADDYVDMEAGTGAVKITPAHDFNDFNVGKRHNLPMISVMDKNACMNENTPEEYRGLDRYAARKKILAELEATEELVKVDDYTTKIPYGDRSGVVVEPLLTDQWYVDAATLAKPAIEAVETGKTQFVPKQWENTYYAWMRTIEPWCISRQLWWGHQIPAWYGPDGHVFVAETEDEARKQADQHYGEKRTITRDPDVLDTWFSSALWPFSTLGWPENTDELKKYYPGDVLVTGFDIIFFWVARMMMMGCHFMKDVPFKTVYIHALVRDAKGQKMSKSKGNVMDPLDLTKTYGADAVRFTLCAMAAQGRDIRLSEQRIEGYRNFATKIWNAARYLEMNGAKPVSSFDYKTVENTVNAWIIRKLDEAVKNIEKSIENFKFNDAAQYAYEFVWNTYCDWYLELTKITSENPKFAPENKATAAWVFDQILLFLNPIMPFITEELYAEIADRKGKKLLEMHWPEYQVKEATWWDDDAEGTMERLQAGIRAIRSIRMDMNVPASAEPVLYVIDDGSRYYASMDANPTIVLRMGRLSQVALVDVFPKGCVQAIVGDMTIGLPVADLIDIAKEKIRLQKEIEKQGEEVKRVDAKLGNQQFVANAPEEIIAEQNARKAEAQTIIAKLSAALKSIAEAA